MRPARIHPPSRPNTSRNASTTAAAGTNLCSGRRTPPGAKLLAALIVGTLRNKYTTVNSTTPASMRNPA
jgi:hypothetical protein